MTWTEEEAAYLDRMARSLGDKLGQRVSRAEVLRGLVHIAMGQEALDVPAEETSPPQSLGLGVHELCRTLRETARRHAVP